jgi:hypothetical protein
VENKEPRELLRANTNTALMLLHAPTKNQEGKFREQKYI